MPRECGAPSSQMSRMRFDAGLSTGVTGSPACVGDDNSDCYKALPAHLRGDKKNQPTHLPEL